MLREGSFALASLGRVRKVHEMAFAVAFGRKSVALKRILDAAFESPSSPGEATFADLMDVLLAIAFTPFDRLAFPQPQSRKHNCRNGDKTNNGSAIGKLFERTISITDIGNAKNKVGPAKNRTHFAWVDGVAPNCCRSPDRRPRRQAA